MDRYYKVSKPSDFILIIKDIFAWCRQKDCRNLPIVLKGDLGAGKTAFTQELGRYLGVTEPITSPTFVVMKQYPVEHANFDELVHIDAYRFESEDEARPLRLEEIFEKPRTIVCLEWPEMVPTFIPDNAFWLDIDMGEGKTRKVRLSQKSKSSVNERKPVY